MKNKFETLSAIRAMHGKLSQVAADLDTFKYSVMSESFEIEHEWICLCSSWHDLEKATSDLSNEYSSLRK